MTERENKQTVMTDMKYQGYKYLSNRKKNDIKTHHNIIPTNTPASAAGSYDQK